MPQKAEHTVHILEGKATLYKRPTSPYWFVRYKVGGKWLRKTTKKETLEEAKDAAVDIVMNAMFRQKNNLPVINKRFKHVAKLAIKRMQDLIAAGQGKVTYQRYIQALEGYLIPFFGNYNIDSIDSQLLKQFDAWRIQQLNRAPAASTINNHNCALNRVFEEAIIHKFINKSQVPYLSNVGQKSARRASFTSENYKQLYEYMRGWVRKGRAGNERNKRQLLRNYVLVLANTGIRAGTESMNLKWRNIAIEEHNKQRFMILYLDGKTGKRSITIRTECIRYFERVQEADKDLKHMSLKEVLNANIDKYVFRVDGKDMTDSFGRMFRRLLEAADLLTDKRTGEKRSLYSLRHYYATYMLTKTDVTAYQLAEYLGTSVGMINKYYGHLDLKDIGHKFAGTRDIDTVLR